MEVIRKVREVAKDWQPERARWGVGPVSTAEDDGKEEEGCNRDEDG